ncbi:MAG: FecR domain-containing protein [Acidobacteria bacterium]|nr:FecR domain-containing protein [Acidobacteriota bacterium]
MENKYRKFYVEWWNIRKSTVWTLIAGTVLIVSLVGGGIWASRNNWFVPEQDLTIPKDAARIVSFEGEVRITRAATRETILVTRETYVGAGDTVQTQADGRAIIQMIDGSVYSVRPNSTMVVKDTTSFFGGKNVRVALDDGQLNVRTDEQPQDAKNIVEVADTENQLLPKTDASFNADPQANSGEIRISRGGVETTIGGEKQIIGENEFASIKSGRLSQRERLMAPPRPISPNNSAQLVDRGGGVAVSFSWADAEGASASNYHLQVSRSPTFASDALLVDRGNMSVREFRLSSLSPGTYYWRVRATARSGQLTNWNEAWKFIVVRSVGGVTIDASNWTVERVGGNVYLINGRTSPGMFVRSQGRETLSGPDGLFKLQISTPSIETSVEISDDRGNRTGFVISLRTGTVLRRY